MPHKTRDLTGERFGRLVAVRFVYSKNRRRYWECKCDCGGTKITQQSCLLTGKTVSCGCRANEIHKMIGNWKRGRTDWITKQNPRLYNIWLGMKKRCYNEKNINYERYGARGITVCDEWKNSFAAFYEWALSHGYSDTLTIDRIDNDSNYCPENCRWATMKEQAQNRSPRRKKSPAGATNTDEAIQMMDTVIVDRERKFVNGRNQNHSDL